MAITNYVTLDRVLSNVKTTPIAGSPNVEESIYAEWAWDCLDQIGSLGLYEHADIVLDVEEGSVVIPKNIRQLQTVRLFDNFSVEPSLYLHEGNPSYDNKAYRISLNRLYTGFNSGQIVLECSVLPTDEETGFPLIPDTTEFLQAVYYYILFKIAERGIAVKSTSFDLMHYYKTQSGTYMEAARRSLIFSTKESIFNLVEIMKTPYLTYRRR
jgi:hypothetical protein